MKRVDESRIVIARNSVDAPPHLLCGFVGESDAQDIAWHDTELADKVSEPRGESPGLSRARPGNDPYEAFGRRNGFTLWCIQCIKVCNHDRINLTNNGKSILKIWCSDHLIVL
jgi:hypothetical protein